MNAFIPMKEIIKASMQQQVYKMWSILGVIAKQNSQLSAATLKE